MYNDYWGHLNGDTCIKNVSKCLKDIQTTRNDFCGRYGGEEFIYMAQNLKYNEAIELGETLREKIFNLNIKYTSNPESESLSISLGGVYGNISNFISKSNMINLADKQLYISKDCGKNMVSIDNLFESFSYKDNLEEVSMDYID